MAFCNSPRGRRTPPGCSLYPAEATVAAMAPPRFGLCPFRSPLLGASLLISFPRATKMFCFARFPPAPKGRCRPIRAGGFPHSGIPGSTAACASPGLFAACHALHRLWPPRHPPRTLTNLPTGLIPVASLRGRQPTRLIQLPRSLFSHRNSFNLILIFVLSRLLVEVVGLEPTTSCLQSRRSPS